VETPDRFEFELDIGQGDGRAYPVVARSPAGEAEGTLHLPFGDRSPASVGEELAIGAGGSPAGQAQAVQAFGQALFDATFGDEVLTLYDASRRQAGEQDRVLRLKLRIQPQELAALPWEFLYDARLDEYVCLFHMPVVRSLEQPQAVQAVNLTPPLRILGMVAAPHAPSRPAAERRKQRLEEATQRLQVLELVKVEWVRGQTWHDLLEAFGSGEWNVFHFAGEGGFDRESGEGYVVLADDRGQRERLSAARLSRLLASSKSLQVVSLSAGERAGGDGWDRFSSTAALLVRRGIPAVLTTQVEMAGQAAEAFTEAFYAALAATLPLDLAVAKARLAVRSELPNTVAWGLPALYTHSPDLRLFNRETLARTAGQRGDEALAGDSFERAIVQYTLAVELGAEPVPQKIALAEEAREALQGAEEALARSEAGVESQADVILKVISDLERLERRLPESQAIGDARRRAREASSGLRDRLWREGQQLMKRKTLGLTLDRQRRQMQESVALLQKATLLDPEENAALRDDLAKAMRRLNYLENAQIRAKAERGRRWRRVGILAAASLGILLLSCLALRLLPMPSLVGRIAPDATATAVHTAGPMPTPTGAVTTTADANVAPTASPTAEPELAPTLAATSTAAATATAVASPTASPSATQPTLPTPTPSPTVQPTLTPTATARPTLPPGDTATAAPEPASPTVSAAFSPTITATTGIAYPVPVLIQPEDIVFLSQEADTRYLMHWMWDGMLEADEWFDIRIWQAGLPHYGVAWTKEPEYEYDICLKGNGQFYWSVAVIRGEDGQWLADLSPEASPRLFSSSRSDEWCREHGRWVQGVVP
jgi:hypothetical protein